MTWKSYMALKCKTRGPFMEIMVASTMIAVVWGLLSLPTVLYFLPPQIQTKQFVQTAAGCANYTKSTCLSSLIEISACLTGTQQNGASVNIAANVDQDTNDGTAQLIISGLSLIGATEMCRSSLIPFMCLYLFPLCDGNGITYKPNTDQCIEISTVLCKDEWIKAQSISVVRKQLPNCQILSTTTTSLCSGMGAQPLQGIKNDTVVNNPPDTTQVTQISCTEPFFFSNGTCLPQCDKWKQYSNEKSTAIDAITILSALLGLTFGIITLVASCIGRQKMFVFPAVIVVYMTVSAIVLSVFVLISFTNRAKLFCSSENLIEAVQSPTPYCSLVGSVYYYSLLQLSVWWLSHVITVFWKIKFPFHAKVIDDKAKFIHLTVVLLGLGLPFISIIVAFTTGGFVVGRFPPVICVTSSGDAAYYTLALPVSIIIAIGTSLLVFVLITIVKHTAAVKWNSSRKSVIGPAEIKIFIVLCYYIIIGSVALVAFTLNATTSANFITKLYQYFACKANGDHNLCDAELTAYEMFTNPEIGTASLVLLGFLPAVNLVYVVSCDNLQRMCVSRNKRSRTFKKQQSTLSTSTTLSSSI